MMGNQDRRNLIYPREGTNDAGKESICLSRVDKQYILHNGEVLFCSCSELIQSISTYTAINGLNNEYCIQYIILGRYRKFSVPLRATSAYVHFAMLNLLPPKFIFIFIVYCPVIMIESIFPCDLGDLQH